MYKLKEKERSTDIYHRHLEKKQHNFKTNIGILTPMVTQRTVRKAARFIEFTHQL